MENSIFDYEGKRNREDASEQEILRRQILSARHKEPARELLLCRNLEEKAEEREDTYSLSFAKLYESDALRVLGEFKEAVACGQKGLALQKEYDYQDLMLMQYNILGLAFMDIKDEQNALDNFFSGIHLAQKLNNNMLLGALYTNIGILYMNIGEYEKSADNFTRGYQAAKKAVHNDDNVNYSKQNYYINVATVKILMNRYDEAWNYVCLLRDSLSKDENEGYKKSLKLLEAKLIARTGKRESAYIACQEALKELEEEPGDYDSFYERADIFEILLDIAYYQEASLLLKKMEILAGRMDIAGIWLKFYDYCIHYLEAVGSESQLLEAYEEYYQYSLIEQKNEEWNRYQRIRGRLELKRTEEKKRQMVVEAEYLRKIAEQDELTETANRRALNEYLERCFQGCQERQMSFGILLLDVDNYKQYNDTYGHLAGDECLRSISRAIKDAVGEYGYVARYGGDEFMVVFQDQTDERIAEISSKIQEGIKIRHISHASSKVSDIVTVTQGIVNRIPGKQEEILHFIHMADNAMYKVKNQRKGTIHFLKNDQ